MNAKGDITMTEGYFYSYRGDILVTTETGRITAYRESSNNLVSGGYAGYSAVFTSPTTIEFNKNNTVGNNVINFNGSVELRAPEGIQVLAGGGGYGIHAGEELVLESGGTIELTGTVRAYSGITIPATHAITTPEGGMITQITPESGDPYYTVTEADSMTAASHVVIEKAYNLWLGETPVTERNKTDILGDGTASYNPLSRTLTFSGSEPNITGTHENALIYARGINLVIYANNGLTLNNPDGFGIYTALGSSGGGALTFYGDLTAATGRDAIWAYSSVSIRGSVDLTVAGAPLGGSGLSVVSAAICANNSYVDIAGGDVNIRITDPASDMPGIIAFSTVGVAGNLTVTTSAAYGVLSMSGQVNSGVASYRWDITAARAAIRGGSISFSDAQRITVPADGKVAQVTDTEYNETFCTVTEADGTTAAAHVVLSPFYLLLGDVEVMDDNKDDPLGNGTASYDSDTGTLTFTTVTPEIPGGDEVKIYAFGDLTVNAPGTLTLNNTASKGGMIHCTGNLTVNCRITGTFNGYALVAYGSMQLNGGADLSYGKEETSTSVVIVALGYDAPVGLTVNGDLKIRAKTTSNVVTANNIHIKGDVDIDNDFFDFDEPVGEGGTVIINPHDACCLCADDGDILIDGSANLSTDGMYGIKAAGSITLQNGSWDVAGLFYALYCYEAINYPNDCEIISPANGMVSSVFDGSMSHIHIVDSDGKAASHVVIVRKALVAASNIVSNSVNFEGKLGLYFYVHISDELLADPNAFAVISFNGFEKTVLISSAPVSTKNGITRRLFSQDVVAKEMRDEITLRLYDGSGKLMPLLDKEGKDVTETGYTYSVMAYLNEIQLKSSDEYMKALAAATDNYGTAAQLYFDYNADNLIISPEVIAVTLSDLAEFAPVYTGTLPEGIIKNTASIQFDEDNTVRQYFTLEADRNINAYTFTLDGTVVTPIMNGTGKYYVALPNIAAQDLDIVHEYSVTDGTDTYSFSFSPLSYVYKIIDGSTNESMINLAKALFLYNQAANEYFAHKN